MTTMTQELQPALGIQAFQPRIGGVGFSAQSQGVSIASQRNVSPGAGGRGLPAETQAHVGGKGVYRFLHRWRGLRRIADAQDAYDQTNEAVAKAEYADALSEDGALSNDPLFDTWGDICVSGSEIMGAGSDLASLLSFVSEVGEGLALVGAFFSEGLTTPLIFALNRVSSELSLTSDAAGLVADEAKEATNNYRAVKTGFGNATDKNAILAAYEENHTDALGKLFSTLIDLTGFLKLPKVFRPRKVELAVTKFAGLPKWLKKSEKFIQRATKPFGHFARRLQRWTLIGYQITSGIKRIQGYYSKITDAYKKVKDFVTQVLLIGPQLKLTAKSLIHNAAPFVRRFGSKALRLVKDKFSQAKLAGSKAWHWAEGKTHDAGHLISEKAHAGGQWIRNKAAGAEHWAEDKAHGAGRWLGGKAHAAEHWLGNKAHAAEHWLGGKARAAAGFFGGKANDIGQWTLQHRAEIGDVLHQASDVFGVLSAVTGVAAAGLALTGVGLPFAAGLGAASLTFAAAAAASRAWYSTTLAVGTLDGSVPVSEANGEMWGAVQDTALVGVGSGLGKIEALGEGAVSMARGESAARVAKASGTKVADEVATRKSLGSLNKLTLTLKRLFKLPLQKVVKDAALAKRLKWLTTALKAADFVNSVVGLVTAPLTAAANTVVASAKFVIGKGKEAVQWGAAKAQQVGSFAHSVGAKATAAVGSFFGGLSHGHGLSLHLKALPGGPLETGTAEQAARTQEQGVVSGAGSAASVPSGARAKLAAQVLTNPHIRLMGGHVSRVRDEASAATEIAGAATGRAAQRSHYENAPGGAVDLDPRMLSGMLGLARDYSFTVSEIAGGSHSKHSRHYAGIAFDVSAINGVPVSARNPHFRAFMAQAKKLGATEVLGPGAAGHSSHVHVGWPRTASAHGTHPPGGRLTAKGRTPSLSRQVAARRQAPHASASVSAPLADGTGGHALLPAHPVPPGHEAHGTASTPATASPRAGGTSGGAASPVRLTHKAQFQNVAAAASRAGDPHPEVTAAQWALESGWGKAPSGKNNLFGIKAKKGQAGTVVPTTEVVGGQRQHVQARFADYDTPEAGLAARVRLLKSPRYEKAGYGRAKTSGEALDALVKARYATDPNYKQKLLPIIQQNWGGGVTAPAPVPSPAKPTLEAARPPSVGNGFIPLVQPMVLQRSGHGDHPDVNPAALRSDLRKQSGGFTPDSNLRGKLGGHLGFDPGGARLHTGPAAAQAARSLRAEAFTIGSDVFFGDGRFDPHSPKGLGLIAHELTHVGQQTGTTGGGKARFFTERGGDEMEREAQGTGERVLANAGRRSGLFVEDYVREYQSEGGLTPTDQQRLDQISVAALQEAERLLASQGLRGGVGVDALDVQVEIDLGEMSDAEAARVWADAIASALGAQQSAAANGSPTAAVQRSMVHNYGVDTPTPSPGELGRVLGHGLKDLTSNMGPLLQPVRHLHLPGNMEITGFVIGVRAGHDSKLGVGGGTAVDGVEYLDLTTNKWSKEAVVSPEVGLGIDAGGSGGVVMGFRVSPRGKYGPIGDAYKGETFSAAAKMLLGFGIGVSPAVLSGKEGFISFSVTAGVEAGVSGSYSYGSGNAADVIGMWPAVLGRVSQVVGYLESVWSESKKHPRKAEDSTGFKGGGGPHRLDYSVLPGISADMGAHEQAARAMQQTVSSGVVHREETAHALMQTPLGLAIQRSPDDAPPVAPVWHAPFDLGDVPDHAKAAIALVQMIAEFEGLKESLPGDEEQARIKAQQDFLMGQEQKMASGDGALTQDEVNQLTIGAGLVKAQYDSLLGTVKASAAALVSQLFDALSSGLPPQLGPDEDALAEELHNAYVNSPTEQNIKHLSDILKATKDYDEKASDVVGKAKKATDYLGLIKASQKLESVNGVLGSVKSHLGDAIDATDKLGTLATFLGVTNQLVGGSQNDISRVRAGIQIADWSVGKMAEAVPVFNLFWNNYYKPAIEFCLKGIEKLLPERDSANRMGELPGWASGSSDAWKRGQDVAPLITNDPITLKHFPGGQPVLDLMFQIVNGGSPVMTPTVQAFFIQQRSLFNAAGIGEIATQSNWETLHPSTWGNPDSAPNLLPWLQGNGSTVWAMLYGSMPHNCR